MNAYTVIKTLLRTEKGTTLEPQRQYLFQVTKSCTKIEIKKAVEEIYKVKVDNVRTSIVPGKRRRVRQDFGYAVDWKKAIVTLQEGQKIEVT